jgi:ADP-heptose:LPS heptosyltransferase
VKRLEWLAKILFAVLMAALCWRPGRRARARTRLQPHPSTPEGLRVLLVRVDNRVGEALLTTPVIELLAAEGHEVHVLTHPKVRRVLEGHPRVKKLWDYRPGWQLLSALRAERFDVVINCGNWDLESVTSAVVARLAGGPSVVLGPANFPSGWLMDVPVAALKDTRSEAAQRAHLASPLVPSAEPVRLSFRPTTAFEVARAPYAVVNPGGRLGFRRVVPERFADAAAALLERGVTPVVTWGPGEEALVDAVCAACPGAVRAPATSLDQLAALMRGAQLTVCNNTGPMHLAVAVGCPTLALFLHMEVERWGHPYAPHHMLDLTGVADPSTAVKKATSAFAFAFRGRSPTP